ncbi:MAG: hypothetical protein ACR2GY_10405 [Phycisphaerales bacterium]
MVLLTTLGCGTGRNGRSTPQQYTPPPALELATMQQDRLNKLALLRSGGVIELKWNDEKGSSHYEQGDITLLIGRPTHLALRIYKIDTLMWLGSNTDRYWFFDLMDKSDEVAYVGRFDQVTTDAALPGLIHPLRLIDLAGLSEIPAETPASYSEEHDAWLIECDGRGGRSRIYLDRTRNWPIVVESLDSAGQPLFRSRLTRYEPVESEGMPPAAFPRLPRRIEIEEVGRDGKAVLQLDGPTTIVDEATIKSATDLDRLLGRFLPDRIEALDETTRTEMHEVNE